MTIKMINFKWVDVKEEMTTIWVNNHCEAAVLVGCYKGIVQQGFYPYAVNVPVELEQVAREHLANIQSEHREESLKSNY